MRQVPFEVLMHAENALSESECAMSVLSMWIDSIPDGEEHREEACRVGAIMSLLRRAGEGAGGLQCEILKSTIAGRISAANWSR